MLIISQTLSKDGTKNKKTHIDVQRPQVVASYNKYMDGVDMVDRMVSLFRIGAKTTNWPVRVIMHFLDCALSNSWIMYRKNEKKLGKQKKDIMDFLGFRMWIVG